MGVMCMGDFGNSKWVQTLTSEGVFCVFRAGGNIYWSKVKVVHFMNKVVA